MITSSDKSPKSLSNLQLELLRLYGRDVSDNTLKEIKLMLAKYFADRASDSMEQVWESRSISPDDMIHWANEHDRIEDRP